MPLDVRWAEASRLSCVVFGEELAGPARPAVGSFPLESCRMADSSPDQLFPEAVLEAP